MRRNPKKLKPNSNCTKRRYASRGKAIAGYERAKEAGMTFGWPIKFYRCATCRDGEGNRTWHWANVHPIHVKTR